MTTNLCGVYEAYSQIVSDCYPEAEASVKIRCAAYLNEYCRKKRITISLADEHFFTEYFLKWLPYKVCREDRRVIDSFYTSADEYVRMADMLSGTSVQEKFDNLDNGVRYESVRLLLLKKAVMEYNNSFVISKLPCIIDFDRYKMKKMNASGDYECRSGLFRADSFFTGNSVVLSHINGEEYYIRLFFTERIMHLIEEGDIFDIKISRNSSGGKWVLDDINGCRSRWGTTDKWMKVLN